MILHKTLRISTQGQGMYLITDKLLNLLGELPESGILNLLVQHTSAGLTINENCDPSVRVDFQNFLSDLISENWKNYTHTLEGPDDMPAHIKSSLMGATLSIPIINHRLALGTWQGIYLTEFRTAPQTRSIIGSIIQ